LTFSPTGAKPKLALDEESFQQLLAAAYTLQENKDVLRAGNSQQDSASVMSEISALRSQILTPPDSIRPIDSFHAAVLVAACVRRLTNADGVSLGLIVDGYLKPVASAGKAVKVAGGSVASNSLVATERLRNGTPFLSANACSDIRLDPAQCVKLKIGSLLALPITVKNDVAGLIELRWVKAEAFRDGDERICQLLIDLMREVLSSQAAKGQPVSAVETEISDTVVHKTVAAGQPVDEKRIETEDKNIEDNNDEEKIEITLGPTVEKESLPGRENVCRVCGQILNSDLNFCGNCGMLASAPTEDLQSKWASMWFMQQAQKAVEPSRQSQPERLWPLKAADTVSSSTHTSAEAADRESEDDPNQVSSSAKRGPRGVLSVLKAQLRPRAGERKLPPS
jgi:RNA polymerase subunit RPABC4/transcription elongation factor Spt4